MTNSLAVLSLLAICLLPVVKCGVLFASLPKSLIVTATINGAPILNDSMSTLLYEHDSLNVSWTLNETFIGNDTNYKQIYIKLCYGAPSTTDKPWRANNADLTLSKTCPYDIKRLNYTPSGHFVYQASKLIPDSLYFPRVFVMNVTGTAPVAAASVAFGQTTDSTRTKNLFHVIGYVGTNRGITIFIIAFSIFSYALLLGFFFVEKAMKKNV